MPRSRPGHRAGDVERKQDALGARHDVGERGVERRVQRVDDLRHRLPRQLALLAAPLRIGLKRKQDRQRMQACLADAVRIAERRKHERQRLAERHRHAHLGQLAEIAHQRRHRHALKQRAPDLRVVQPLRRHSLARQIVLQDERGDPVRVRSRLHRKVRPDELRQSLANRVVACPVEQILAGRLIGDRMREPQEVAVRPAPALTVLHHLQREPVGRSSPCTTPRSRA